MVWLYGDWSLLGSFTTADSHVCSVIHRDSSVICLQRPSDIVASRSVAYCGGWAIVPIATRSRHLRAAASQPASHCTTTEAHGLTKYSLTVVVNTGSGADQTQVVPGVADFQDNNTWNGNRRIALLRRNGNGCWIRSRLQKQNRRQCGGRGFINLYASSKT